MARKPPPRNRRMDGRLWDDAGREWAWTTGDLSKAEVEPLIHDPAVRLAVQDDYGPPIRWIDASARAATWRELVPVFADGGTELDARWRQHLLPYQASLWSSGDDRLLLLESD